MTRRAVVEAALIGVMALAATVTSIVVAPGVPGLLGAGLALVMLAIAVADGRQFIIPDSLTAAALCLALVNAGVHDGEAILQGAASAVLRGAVLAAGFLALRTVYHRIRQRHGIGIGDVKLAVAAGAWLSWTMIPIAVEIAALAALAGYALRHYISGRPIRATAKLPFGLYFAPAIWLCWLLEVTLLAS